ncbi:Nuclease [Actinidia chinensis var. chinensis]|uniref:Nuclease n=1 Tax=Actinidia chinensis var. chinensis TaxID=1590841 RepID=A0A2R6PL66_ACTCC|nr:Nuclease [Actinidia chinensis var. chinensis]
MGPIRGHKKRKRKRVEKVVDQNAPNPSLPYQPQALDWWDQFSKRITGPSSQSKDLPRFESVLKISRKTFNYICSLVKEEMMAKPANFTDLNGKLLSLNDRVAVAIRRLSSGESLSAVGNLLGINQSTVAQITWRFSEAMENRGIHHLRWPATEAEMNEIKLKFEKIGGLPNCCGVVDTTHILMCLSSMDPSTKIWCDDEKNHSMILQAIVDPEMRFLDIVTGWPGSMSHSLVLKSSSFFRLCEEGERLNGKKIKLLGETELREYIIGDAAFPLLPWLLTPYPYDPYQRPRSHNVFVSFNMRLSATKMVALRALTRLKETWRIINGVMWRPDKNRLPRIILVCCILHNICIDLEDEVQREIPVDDVNAPGYRQQVCEYRDETASSLRDDVSLYLDCFVDRGLSSID